MMKNLTTYIIAAVLFSSIASSDTVDIQVDTPNIGDTTYHYVYQSGESASTNNLISQVFNDGTWTGTQFPDSSDLNEAKIITGKHLKYAETTISTIGVLTENEIKLGFTSNFTSDIRWWNSQESTVTLSQSLVDNLGNTTSQNTLLVDTTNHNYQYNNYGNTLIVSPNVNLTHGDLTARYDFNILGNPAFNNSHAGVDITNPKLILDFTALSTAQSTVIEYCWEKNPPTCPAQEELTEFENIIDDLEDDIYQIINTNYVPETEIEVEDFFFEEDYFEIDYYEELELEYSFEEVIVLEEIELLDEIPTIQETEEIAFIDEPYIEEFFEEEISTEEIIEEFVEVIEEAPIKEEIIEVAEEIIEEEIIEEEIVEETPIEAVEEETIEIAEETIEEEVVEEEAIEVAQEEEVEVKEDTIEIKKAQLEEIINEKDLDQVHKVAITLEAVNILVSQELIKAAVNISAFQNNDVQDLFTYSVMPQGVDMVETALPAVYYQDFYSGEDLLANMITDDPIAQYEIAVNKAVNTTNQKQAIYRSLINAKSND